MELISDVRLLIGAAIDELVKLRSVDVAISSLGAGGDMLFAAEIIKRKIPLIIYLPFDKDEFIRTSVAYTKVGDPDYSSVLRSEFDRIFEAAIDVRVVTNSTGDDP
jgi:hypothetical protein